MQNFGRYKIVEQIGSGAMGAVYKAVDPMMDRDVAIKTILTHAIEGPQSGEFLDRFFREARAAGRLAHPGIVTMYDVSEHEGTPFLVMEYVAGRNLQSILQQGERMEIDRIYDVSIQLAEALDYAHKNGVIHRDIKPSNILMTPDGRVKIADFGVARLAESQMTFTGGQLLGTPAFMAPEQFTGVRIDGRADLFAAGVVIYWMVTGDKPFTGDTLLAVQYKVVNTDPVPPRVLNPVVSRSLEAVVLKALAKDPAERYQSGDALASDLRAARANMPVSAKPLTRPTDDTPTIAFKPPPPPVQVSPPGATAAANTPPRKARRRNPVAFMAVIMASVILLRLVNVVNTRFRLPPENRQTAQNTAVAPAPPEPVPPAAKKTESRKRPAGESQDTRGKAAAAVPEKAPAKPDSITLDLVAQDRSSILFRAEGQPTQTLLMKAGDAMTLHAGKDAGRPQIRPVGHHARRHRRIPQFSNKTGQRCRKHPGSSLARLNSSHRRRVLPAWKSKAQRRLAAGPEAACRIRDLRTFADQESVHPAVLNGHCSSGRRYSVPAGSHRPGAARPSRLRIDSSGATRRRTSSSAGLT